MNTKIRAKILDLHICVILFTDNEQQKLTWVYRKQKTKIQSISSGTTQNNLSKKYFRSRIMLIYWNYALYLSTVNMNSYISEEFLQWCSKKHIQKILNKKVGKRVPSSFLTHLSLCSISIRPKNVRKPNVNITNNINTLILTKG